MTEQRHLFDDQAEPAGDVARKVERPKTVPLSQRPNPMIAAVGAYAGEPGTIRVCGDCVYLVWKGGHRRRYYGCEKRGPMTNGPATDHLVRWEACALFLDDRDGTIRGSDR